MCTRHDSFTAVYGANKLGHALAMLTLRVATLLAASNWQHPGSRHQQVTPNVVHFSAGMAAGTFELGARAAAAVVCDSLQCASRLVEADC
jgi:hypothetical protein